MCTENDIVLVGRKLSTVRGSNGITGHLRWLVVRIAASWKVALMLTPAVSTPAMAEDAVLNCVCAAVAIAMAATCASPAAGQETLAMVTARLDEATCNTRLAADQQ